MKSIKKILIAPDSFKGSLSAREVVDIIEKSIKNIMPYIEVIKVPIADGGEGTLESISYTTKEFKLYKFRVTSPLYKKKTTAGILYNKDKDLALVEMAQASGITLLKEDERNPIFTTTYGTGELIRKALNLGAKKIIVFCGGSATCDAGVGALSALGVKFYDKEKKETIPEGRHLLEITDFDIYTLDKRVKNTDITVATDVRNPLTGKEGSSYVFSPQKGANKKEVEMLDKGLRRFAKIVREKLKIDVEKIQGAGAAGGLPAGLVAFCGAKIKSGFEVISEITQLEKKIKNSDLVITGEGKIDRQTKYGKVVYQIAKISKKYNIPVIAIVGAVENDIDLADVGVSSIFSIINRPMSLQEAIERARSNLKWTAEQIINCLKYIQLDKKPRK